MAESYFALFLGVAGSLEVLQLHPTLGRLGIKVCLSALFTLRPLSFGVRVTKRGSEVNSTYLL